MDKKSEDQTIEEWLEMVEAEDKIASQSGINEPIKPNSKLKVLAWLLGLLYTTFIGYFALPYGLGATICSATIIGSLFLFARTKSEIPKLYLVIGMLLSLSFIWTSNQLVGEVSAFSALICILMLCCVAIDGQLPGSHQELISKTVALIQGYFRELFLSIENFCNFLTPPQINAKSASYNFKTSIIAFLSLFVFHFLFSIINKDYADFINPLIQYIWEFIKFIIDAEFIFYLGVQSYLIYGFFLLISKTSQKGYSLTKIENAEVSIRGVLSPVVVLTAVFSVFQIKFFFILETLLKNFKDFSLYVQGGFWELLLVAAIGFGFWLWGYLDWEKTREKNYLFWLLSVFSLEIILVCMFAAHKIFLLQAHFGIKDQRIYATQAVLLLFVTFIGCFTLILSKIKLSELFKFQLWALLCSTTFLAYVNVDSVVSNFHPISYRLEDGKWNKDYSYLLTNSYDNVADWKRLITEANSGSIAYPKTYYWGNYKPLCERGKNYFKNHVEAASRNMTLDGSFADLKKAMRFNTSDYRAHRFRKNNSELLKRFYRRIQKEC